MNSTIYEMEGSPQMELTTSYELNGDMPASIYSPENLESQFPVYFSNSQFGLDLLPQWPQSPEPRPQVAGSRPLYRSGTTPVYGSEPSCLFRSEILDDCAKARFYARMLEFYLLDNEHQNASVGCPMASCPAHDFKHPKDMLRHLKNCKFFEKGKFWCPTCRRYESFKVRSNKQCSWDKEHNIGRKLLQKSKDVFRGFGVSRSGAQQPLNCGLCAMCSAPLPVDTPIQNGRMGSFCQSSPVQVANQSQKYHQPGPPTNISRPHELDSTSFSELCAGSAPSNSQTQFPAPLPESPVLPPVYHNNHQGAMSEVSLVSTSPHPSAFSISPTSSTHEDTPLVNVSHDVGSMLKMAHHSEFPQSFIESNNGFGQHNTGAPVNNTPSHELRSLVHFPAACAPIPEQLATSSTLPSTLRRPTVHQETPIFRGQTLQSRRRPVALVLGLDITSNDPQNLDSLTRARTVSSSVETVDQTRGIAEGLSATQERSPLSASAPLSARSVQSSQSSTLTSMSEKELKCNTCGYKPKGNLKSYLRKHEDIHKGNQIPCTHCKATFTRQDNLTTHLRKTHRIFNRSLSKRRRDSSDSLQSLFSGPKRKEICTRGSDLS